MIIVILPIKNEEKTIRETIKELSYFLKEEDYLYRIVCVDDHSTDKTFKILSELAGENTNIIPFFNTFDCGKGYALKYGYTMISAFLSLSDTDIIVFMDGDGQIRPKDISFFIKQMNFFEADAVVGNKRHLLSILDYPLKRKVVSITFNKIIKMLFGISLNDTQCGIKIFKNAALSKAMKIITTKKYAFDLELLVYLKENHFRIADAPVFIKPQTNLGSVSIKSIIITFIETIKIWIRKKRGFYKWQKS